MSKMRACLVGLAFLALSPTLAVAEDNGTGGAAGAEMPSDASATPPPDQSGQMTPTPQSDDTGAMAPQSPDSQSTTPETPPAGVVRFSLLVGRTTVLPDFGVARRLGARAALPDCPGSVYAVV